jgi:hypothetical protein
MALRMDSGIVIDVDGVLQAQRDVFDHQNEGRHGWLSLREPGDTE